MSAQRILFLGIATNILIGIWLTGFPQVHWWLYVPLVFLTFAGVTGICPAMILIKKLGFK